MLPVGTLFRIRSSGNAPPEFVERLGDVLLLISDVFERVEDDRWREFVIVTLHCLARGQQHEPTTAYRASCWLYLGCPVGTTVNSE